MAAPTIFWGTIHSSCAKCLRRIFKRPYIVNGVGHFCSSADISTVALASKTAPSSATSESSNSGVSFV